MSTTPSFPASDEAHEDSQRDASRPEPAFPAVPVKYLLQKNGQLISRIKLCYGADRTVFEAEVLSLIQAYAAFVHMLPASHVQGFTEPGGLLRLGLEVGFFALQGTDARIFSGRSTILVRQEIEPRWRLATFIAGLCSELHLAVGGLLVSSPSGEIWPACLHPLSDWLEQRGVHHYNVTWNSEFAQARGFGLFALSHVVPASVLQDLAFCNPVIIPHLLASISGLALAQPRNVLDELVRRSLALVIRRDLLRNSRPIHPKSARLPIGLHVKRFLLDAMRYLLCFNGNWAPNAEKSRVRFGADGLYLIWPQAAYDVLKLWEQDQLEGLPSKPEDLLEVLAALDLCDTKASPREAVDSSGIDDLMQPNWASAAAERSFHPTAQLFVIQPPGSKIPWQAIRLRYPESILTAMQPEPIPLGQSMQQPLEQVEPTGPHSERAAPKETDKSKGNPSEAPFPPKPPRVQTTEHTVGPNGASAPAQSSKPAFAQAQFPFPPDRQVIEGGEGMHPTRGADHASGASQAEGGSPSKPIAESSPAASPASAPQLNLQASFRLNPALIDVLRTALNAVQSGVTSAACVATPEGLFVALDKFESHGFPAAIAIRTLLDAKMLTIPPAGEPSTVTLEIGGEPVRGIVIAARFISGWPSAPNQLFEPCTSSRED